MVQFQNTKKGKLIFQVHAVGLEIKLDLLIALGTLLFRTSMCPITSAIWFWIGLCPLIYLCAVLSYGFRRDLVVEDMPTLCQSLFLQFEV